MVDPLVRVPQVSWSLEGPGGTEVAGAAMDAGRDFVELTPGEYELVVSGNGDATSAYSLVVALTSSFGPLAWRTS